MRWSNGRWILPFRLGPEIPPEIARAKDLAKWMQVYRQHCRHDTHAGCSLGVDIVALVTAVATREELCHRKPMFYAPCTGGHKEDLKTPAKCPHYEEHTDDEVLAYGVQFEQERLAAVARDEEKKRQRESLKRTVSSHKRLSPPLSGKRDL